MSTIKELAASQRQDLEKREQSLADDEHSCDPNEGHKEHHQKDYYYEEDHRNGPRD